MKKLLAGIMIALIIAALLCPFALTEEEIAPEAVDAPVEAADSVELTDENGGEMLEAQAEYAAPEILLEGDAAGIPIDEAHFPDAAFRQYLTMFDSNGDSYLFDKELSSTALSVDGLGVTSLKGIEYFPNLEFLSCSNNALTSLDISKNTKLFELKCTNCGLTALTIGNCPALQNLDCTNNNLTALDVSNCPLLVEIVDDAYADSNGYRLQDGTRYFYYDSKVTLTAGSKVLVPIPIDEAHFPDPVFRQIILSGFYDFLSNLVEIDHDKDGYLSNYERQNCMSLNLYEKSAEMRLYGSHGMNMVGIGISSLQGIEYFPNLTQIWNIGNNLTSLDLSGLTSLNSLFCVGNSALESLNVSGCTNLTDLNCYYNVKMSSLIIDGCNNLTTLDCTDNRSLTKLDVTNCQDFANRIKNGRWGQGVLHNVNPGTTVRCDKKLKFIGLNNTTPAVPAAFAEVEGATNATVTVDASSTASNTKASVTATPGSVTQLDLSGATGKKFKSSNKKVATVNSAGQATFKGPGKVKITYKVGKKTRKVTLTVADPTYPTSIALNLPAAAEAKVGETQTLTATLNEGAVSEIKWKSSKKKIAAVDANGVVTFKKAGKVKITATTTRGKLKASVTFKVGK